ncbi:MAG TPA: P-II family nitrogen regulator [Vicinamibacteria bacterium]|nr:P-II family nitrogen regulator [Vicinamibacteria bacterium]
MKLIVAVIRPEALEAVQAALDEPGVTLASAGAASGGAVERVYRGVKFQALQARVRLEIVVANDTVAPTVLDAVVRAASCGGRRAGDDGLVLLMDLADCVRVPVRDGPYTSGAERPDLATHRETLVGPKEGRPTRDSRPAAFAARFGRRP